MYTIRPLNWEPSRNKYDKIVPGNIQTKTMVDGFFITKSFGLYSLTAFHEDYHCGIFHTEEKAKEEAQKLWEKQLLPYLEKVDVTNSLV